MYIMTNRSDTQLQIYNVGPRINHNHKSETVNVYTCNIRPQSVNKLKVSIYIMSFIIRLVVFRNMIMGPHVTLFFRKKYHFALCYYCQHTMNATLECPSTSLVLQVTSSLCWTTPIITMTSQKDQRFSGLYKLPSRYLENNVL